MRKVVNIKRERDLYNSIKDFTISEYIELLNLAGRNYTFIKYTELDWFSEKKYILWRHDCDFSLNRSLRVAQIEHEKSVVSTFFVNSHSEFYNLQEKSQVRIIDEILSLGHGIGLHFDAYFYDIDTEDQLDMLVAREASWIEEWFGVMPVAVSFHNPSEFLLTCNNDIYGGLINCYSSKFKRHFPYCSDSNGYWRYERLSKVLEDASYARLQVLTHPAWWQEKPMIARERIFRCVDGRAKAITRFYDHSLNKFSRENQSNREVDFEFLNTFSGQNCQQLDQRWMRGESAGVLLYVWRLFDARLVKYCRIFLCCLESLSLKLAHRLLEACSQELLAYKLLIVILEKSWLEISGVDEREYLKWHNRRLSFVLGYSRCSHACSIEGFDFLIRVIKTVDENCKQYFADLKNTANKVSGIRRVCHRDEKYLWNWVMDHLEQLDMSEKTAIEIFENKFSS